MISDPLFIIGSIGMALCLFGWIKFNLSNTDVEPFIMRYISSISFISGLALLLSIFYNSGDLGIVLLVGSIIAFIVMVFGYYVNNNEIKIRTQKMILCALSECKPSPLFFRLKMGAEEL